MKKLDIGSGFKKRQGFESLDFDQKTNPTWLYNIEESFPFTDNAYDYIMADNILEHIKPWFKNSLMNELWRITVNGGKIEIYVPEFPHPESVQDPTHYSFWHERTFLYYNFNSTFHQLTKKRSTETIPAFVVTLPPRRFSWELHVILRPVK